MASIFVSHSSRDQAAIERVVARLRAEEESRKLMTQTRQEITRLAVEAAQKVLVSQEEAYDQFLQEAEKQEKRDETHE